ncbi:MAG: hypothetical protein HY905_08105 [Deltaproteobacteria bacterium]|nr:hypothetical protein [Deltaproteobacteria bacterium]
MRTTASATLLLGLLAASPSAAWELRDTTYVDVGFASIGPGIPEVGEGFAFGGTVGALIQEEESDDFVLYVRPGLEYYRSYETWDGDDLEVNIAGLSTSIGFGIGGLGNIVPYVDVGIEPVGMFALEPEELWDWGIGMRGSFGVVIGLGDMFILRPAVGISSFIFADLDRPMGGLWFTLAFGIDSDPIESYDDDGGGDETEDFWIGSSTLYASPGSPGGAMVWIQRNGGFSDTVSVWADPPPGTVAVPIPDPASGPDYWRILVHASPEACYEFSLPVHASGGGVQKDTTVWVSPSCGTGGAP